ncbi:MAG: hydantoinase/oxoprolinase family protein [Pusillimonas sp.]
MNMNRLGVDVGGTFTDVILVNQAQQRIWTVKVPTTPEDPSVGVINGIRSVLKESGKAGTDIDFIGHGTTIATNLLVEGKGAKTGLITTKGFRDVLEIRRASRHDRADLYDMLFDAPQPVVPRMWRREISARNRYDGTEISPLDPIELKQQLAELHKDGVEAIALCFLHSYRNPQHEQWAATLSREFLPDTFITTSVDVNPEIFEYERTSTTVINATLGPRCANYFRTLEKRIADSEIEARVYLMQSNGGLTKPREAAERPVGLLESGPAGGVTAAAKLCRRKNLPNAIVGDVGGTTFDVSLVRNFEPEIRQSSEISSYIVRAPTIDIASIGAGGGSIARIDAAGGIRVGPDSAGASPGPACYGRNGMLPTVTDCNLVLGYLSAEHQLGGHRLDKSASCRAIEQHLAKPLGVSIEEAAHGVRSIANAHMAQAIRLITIERGYDPREFVYIAFGGGGPVHAVEVAELLELPTVIVPPHPGLFSAFGMLVADMVHDFQAPVLRNLEDMDISEFRSGFSTLEGKAQDRMRQSNIPLQSVTLHRRVDCRYLGQAEPISIDMPDECLEARVTEQLHRRFTEAHQRAWNFTLDRPIIVTNLRLRALGTLGEYATAPCSVKDKPVPTRECKVMFQDRFDTIPCYQRADISPGISIQGPAMIEEQSTSLTLGARHTMQIDDDGNMIINLGVNT